MEIETNPPFNWANDAFVSLHDVDGNSPSHDKWPTFASAGQSFPPAAFSIPPGLVSQASIERYGQITPPDELSPAAPESEKGAAREGSVPVEQLRNEVSWPVEQQIRNSLANYQPQAQQQQQQQQQDNESQGQDESPRNVKRRRTSSKQSSANQSQAGPAPPPQTQTAGTANPDPPKRKRGRPKSQPQIIEGFTADGFPFQVTSARQSHLEKNRVAAHKCRQRKKEYINGLEARAREFSAKNKALKENVAMLREDVLELKNEVLRHAGCGFWAVDEYLARCAGDLLGMENPALQSRTNSQVHSLTIANLNAQKERQMSTDSIPSQISMDSFDEDDNDNDYEGLDLVNDLDHDMGGVEG